MFASLNKRQMDHQRAQSVDWPSHYVFPLQWAQIFHMNQQWSQKISRFGAHCWQSISLGPRLINTVLVTSEQDWEKHVGLR